MLCDTFVSCGVYALLDWSEKAEKICSYIRSKEKGCPMNVYHANGAFAGIVDEDGLISDASGTYVGNIDRKGFVFNWKNIFVGQVRGGINISHLSDTRVCALITSAANKLVGSVDEDGNIYQAPAALGNPDDPPFKKIGHVSSPRDYSLSGAAIWLLIEDYFFTLRKRACHLREEDQHAGD
jgi:hypothetical protein